MPSRGRVNQPIVVKHIEQLARGFSDEQHFLQLLGFLPLMDLVPGGRTFLYIPFYEPRASQ